MKNHSKLTITGGFVLTLGLVGCGTDEQEVDIGTEDFLLVEEISGDNPDCGLRNAILEAADTNGDGVLDEAERQAFREAKRAELLAAYDADGDGRLNAEERRAAREGQRTARFESLDADGNGGLSAEEVAGSCRLSFRFDVLDADGNGEISLEEFSAQRWPRPRPGRRR